MSTSEASKVDYLFYFDEKTLINFKFKKMKRTIKQNQVKNQKKTMNLLK